MTTLREQIARINPGDTVSMEVRSSRVTPPATVTGEAWGNTPGALYVGPLVLRHAWGDASTYLHAILTHTPATPPEPPLWSMRHDSDGDLWIRTPLGWSLAGGTCGECDTTRGYDDWATLQHFAPYTDPTA